MHIYYGDDVVFALKKQADNKNIFFTYTLINNYLL